MSTVAMEALARLVHDDVLAYPERHEWTLQGFGMLRTYLGEDRRLRLHVWDSRFRTKDVSDVHDHPWDFESLVLRGSIRNVRYDARESVFPVSRQIHCLGRITCGPSPEVRGPQDVKRICLFQQSDVTYEAGERYVMSSVELHASVPEDGTVTVCRRSFVKKDTETARVCWPLGTEWVGAEPRAATPEEVREITRGARLREWSLLEGRKET